MLNLMIEEAIMKNTDLPANPLANEELATEITKREHFAAMALQGFLANPVMGDSDLHNSPSEWRGHIAKAAVEFADATLAVLNADQINNVDDIEKLRKGIVAIRVLIGQSEGVTGLHMNGDVAYWSELEEGGRFDEWLLDFNIAEAI